MLLLHAANHVFGREVVATKLLGVEPDADVARLQSTELHAAHIGDCRDQLLELLLGKIAEHVDRLRVAREREPHHGQVVRIDLGNHGRVNFDRQPPAGRPDRVLHFLHRHIDIARQAEIDVDDRQPLQRLRQDVIDALDAGDRVFDLIGDIGIDGFRRRVFERDRHADDRKVDLRKLADAEFAVAEPAEHDHRRRKHDGEDGIADREVGQRHFGLRIADFGFRIRGPQNPKSAIRNPQSPVPVPKSEIRNPQSEISRPGP